MIEYLPLVLTGIGIIISILYYASVLRNANKTQQLQLETRQAQLFMNIHSQSFGSLTWSKSLRTVLSAEFTDYDDYMKKYRMKNPTDKETGEHMMYIFNFFEGLGVYVREGLIDVRLVALTMTSPIELVWEKYEEVTMMIRERLNQPRWWSEFEYLYNEVKKYNKTHLNP